MAVTCLLCGFVGIYMLVLKHGEQKLSEKLRHDSTLHGHLNKFYLGGGNEPIDDTDLFATKLLERDFPQLARASISGFGQIFVPETFLTSYPTVLKLENEPEAVKSAKEYENHCNRMKGEWPEREAFLALQKYFKTTGEDVLVIHSLNYLNLNEIKKKQAREKDFILLNLTHKYIMAIEVKNLLGIKGKKSSLDSTKEQLEDTKKRIESWFGADISSNWRYIAISYTNKIEDDPPLQLCSTCSDFTIEGESQLPEKMAKITQLLNEHHMDRHIEEKEFTFVAKYLLFCASLTQMPVPSIFNKLVAEAVDKAGSAENIRQWMSWTPLQLSAFSSSRLMLYGSFSTGKTILMMDKARTLAKAEADKKVLFIVVNTVKTNLLKCMLIDHFKDLPNVEVKWSKPPKLDALDKWLSSFGNFDHIFVDELRFSANSGSLTEWLYKSVDFRGRVHEIWESLFSSSKHVTLWISPGSLSIRLERLLSFAEDELPKISTYFDIIQLSTPLRNPKNVVAYTKSTSTFSFDLRINGLQNGLLPKLVTPTNSVLGAEVKEVTSFNEAFQMIPPDEKVLILAPGWILYFLFKNGIEKELIDSGRKYLVSFTEDQLMDWMADKIHDDLICYESVAIGYEFNTVISYGKASSNLCMRAKSKLIIVLPSLDYFSKTKGVFDKFLHNWAYRGPRSWKYLCLWFALSSMRPFDLAWSVSLLLLIWFSMGKDFYHSVFQIFFEFAFDILVAFTELLPLLSYLKDQVTQMVQMTEVRLKSEGAPKLRDIFRAIIIAVVIDLAFIWLFNIVFFTSRVSELRPAHLVSWWTEVSSLRCQVIKLTSTSEPSKARRCGEKSQNNPMWRPRQPRRKKAKSRRF